MSSSARLTTFVIPAYNAEETILRTLDSLVAQTDPRWGAIVVNDGSTDRTADRVRSVAADSIQLINQQNTGLSGARNAGWAEVDTRFVCFLDADDTIDPEYLEKMHSAAGQSSKGAICGFRFVDGLGQEMSTAPPPTNEMLKFPGLLSMDPPPVMSILHHAEFLRQVADDEALFDTSLGPFEDWDLLRRIAEQQEADWSLVHDQLVSYWCTPHSLTTNTRSAYVTGLDLILRHAPDRNVADRYTRKHLISSLAEAVISGDQRTVEDIGLIEIGPEDLALLGTMLRWHACRRWAIPEVQLEQHIGTALECVEKMLEAGNPLRNSIRSSIEGWASNPWVEHLRNATALLGDGGRLVLFGAGRNGIKAAAAARAQSLNCVYTDDERARTLPGLERIEVGEVRAEDVVVITPVNSASIAERLMSSGLRVYQ